jgi:ankyrin repeat protein
MWAAAYGHLDTVKLLLARGADPRVADDRGKTAGTIAVEGNHGLVAGLLGGSAAASRERPQ